MNGLGKISYILIGMGIGVLASSYVLEHEFNKPIGEIEKYIPLEDRNVDDTEYTKEDSNLSSERDIRGGGSSEKDIPQKGNRELDGDERGRESGSHAEFESSQADLYHFYSSAEGNIYDKRSRRKAKSDGVRTKDDARREEFEKMRAEESANLKKRYSKMYRGGDGQNETSSVDDILHVVSANTDTRESWNDVSADSPDDDEPEFIPPYERISDIHDEYVLEQIEDKFEIFLDDNPQDFVTLTYYKGDYTLCDDCEQIIPNAEEVVGMAALNRLIEGGPGVFDNVIYVHNMKTGINYEVVLAEGMYKETVAGMFDEKMSRRR